jgi:dihydroflavonol-4-reductase
MVYTSTGATLAAPGPGFAGHYRTSKAQAERLVEEAAAAGFPAAIEHPTTVLGPGDRRPTPTGSLIVHYLARRMVLYLEMQQNVVHVEDVAEGYVLALDAEPGAHVLGGDNLSMRALPSCWPSHRHSRAAARAAQRRGAGPRRRERWLRTT